MDGTPHLGGISVRITSVKPNHLLLALGHIASVHPSIGSLWGEGGRFNHLPHLYASVNSHTDPTVEHVKVATNILFRLLGILAWLTTANCASLGGDIAKQVPILRHARNDRNVSVELFTDLEELARVVDISYCVGGSLTGIEKPFECLSRCTEFPDFELVDAWETGRLLSDSCGYIALDHGKKRVIVAFRGTYSIANTVVDLSTVPQKYEPYPGSDEGDEAEVGSITADAVLGTKNVQTKCDNCTVHMGFHTAWLHTRKRILPTLAEQLLMHPDYRLNLVGHSLGGAVAGLAALDLKARGWDPLVTTFGEPRIGNAAMAKFLDERFNLNGKSNDDGAQRYRRVTHVDDPVPLLPLSEWNYVAHAGEIFISKPSLSPDIIDLEHCHGDNDQRCIAGQDSTTADDSDAPHNRKRDLIASVEDEIHDVVHEPWGVPSRYKLWQLFFAHRDYFWRLGLCMPSLGGGGGLQEGGDH